MEREMTDEGDCDTFGAPQSLPLEGKVPPKGAKEEETEGF